MAIQGSLEEAGLPDVLQLLSGGRKTGSIGVTSGNLAGQIFLAAGAIIYATITSRRDRLADMMATAGRISRAQLQRVTAEQTKPEAPPVAEILVGHGIVQRDELVPFAQRQMEENILFMFRWMTGEFRFAPNEQPPAGVVLVNIPADRLLLEGGRRVDDWELIRRKVPSFDLVFKRLANTYGAAAMQQLSVEQKAIYLLLDGTRDGNDLMEHTGLSDFDVGKALCGLVMANLAEQVERVAGVRHYDGTEMLAYALRQGEFEDAAKRKEAARHITDCVRCATRLRNVARETTETAIAMPPEPKAPVVVKTPRLSRPVPAPPPPPKKPALPAVGKTPPPEPPRPSSDIVWLASPEEVKALPPKPAPLPPPPPAPPPPEPPPPPPPPAPPPGPKAEPVIERPAARSSRVTVARGAPAPKPEPVAATKSSRRWLIPAGIAAALAIGLVAWRMMSSRPSTHTEVAQAPPAPAAAPPETTRAAAPAPVPPPAPAPAPAQAPAPSPPPAAAPPSPARVREPAPEPPPPPPLAPDAGLGGWTVIDRGEAASLLGGAFAAIPGLRTESIATSSNRGTVRVRVAQITRTNERVVLIQTGSLSEGESTAGLRASGVSVTPAPPGQEAIGSASLGTIQVVAQSAMDATQLRRLLGRLSAVQP